MQHLATGADDGDGRKVSWVIEAGFDPGLFRMSWTTVISVASSEHRSAYATACCSRAIDAGSRPVCWKTGGHQPSPSSAPRKVGLSRCVVHDVVQAASPWRSISSSATCDDFVVIVLEPNAPDLCCRSASGEVWSHDATEQNETGEEWPVPPHRLHALYCTRQESAAGCSSERRRFGLGAGAPATRRLRQHADVECRSCGGTVPGNASSLVERIGFHVVERAEVAQQPSSRRRASMPWKRSSSLLARGTRLQRMTAIHSAASRVAASTSLC